MSNSHVELIKHGPEMELNYLQLECWNTALLFAFEFASEGLEKVSFFRQQAI